MRSAFALVLAAACLALGIASAGYFASQTVLNGRTGANTASAKGLSERVVQANTGSWRVGFTSPAYPRGTPVAPLFTEVDTLSARIAATLRDAGLNDDEIFVSAPRRETQVERNRDGEVTVDQVYVAGSVRVVTDRPALLNPARLAVIALEREGVALSTDSPSYDFTALNDIKPDMLREATENARVAADEFARNAGVTVGGIQSATQGGFQISTAPGAAPGAPDLLVRVVTNITFYLEN